MIQDARLLDEWAKQQVKDKAGDRDAIRTARKVEIERRLLLAGWLQSEYASAHDNHVSVSDLFLGPSFDDKWAAHKLVKEPKAITERSACSCPPSLHFA